MEDFESKLNKLLASPESMEQIMNVARSFSKETEPSGRDGPEDGGPPPGGPDVPAAGLDLSSLLQGFGAGDFDPKMLQMITKVMGAYSANDSRNVNLITALKPYLKEERHGKLDRAVQIAKMAKAARVIFSDFGGGGKNV